MARIIFARAAHADLQRIVDYLLQQSPEAAAQAVHRVQSAIDVLREHPLIGRQVQGEIRELVVSRGAVGYVGLYRFDLAENVVRVLRIRHQREAGFQEFG